MSNGTGNGGLNNLYLPYKGTFPTVDPTTGLPTSYSGDDDGTRPLPAGVDFWASPGVALNPSPGYQDPSTYNLPEPGNPPLECDILVTVVNKDPQVSYTVINVEVWLCNPTTLATPDQFVPIALGSTTTYMLGAATPPQLAAIIPVLVQNQFYPYPGISTLAGGHVCLIANCYGMTADDQDGNSLLPSMTTARFDKLVQSNQHVAQHNIFAAPTSQHQVRFGFNAASGLISGHEDVHIEILHLTGSSGLTAGDLAFLHNGPYKNLPLHPGTHPVKKYAIHDVHGHHHHHHHKHGPLRLHAKTPVPFQVEVELDPSETKGAVQAFDVIQTGASGQVQGGIHLLVVVPN